MTVNELISVCASADIFSVWANTHCDEGGKYLGSFGIFNEFSEKYGLCEVISIYPACKDVLSVAIAVEDK